MSEKLSSIVCSKTFPHFKSSYEKTYIHSRIFKVLLCNVLVELPGKLVAIRVLVQQNQRANILKTIQVERSNSEYREDEITTVNWKTSNLTRKMVNGHCSVNLVCIYHLIGKFIDLPLIFWRNLSISRQYIFMVSAMVGTQ